MAQNQTNKLVWIVETIYRAHKISFEELNHRRMDNVDLSGGEEMLKRTFHKWKWNIFDIFGLSIECEKVAPYKYFIANVDDMKSDSIQNWLLSTLSVSNSLLENKSIKDRIIPENVPSGRDHYVMPLCVKLFRQRWYMVGRNWTAGKNIVFCLDRIQDFRLSSHTYEYPEEFNPQEFFDGCIGVIPGDGCDIEKVRIKVNSGQANYLRDLPLHESQQETEQTDGYSIFELQVRPTIDFQQELLWNGENLKVLEPLWLRKEIAGKIKRMWNQYKEQG